MRMITVIVTALALAVAGCGDDDSSDSTPEPVTTRCPDIPFAAATDNVTSSIRIANGSCDDAKALIRAVDSVRGPRSRGDTFRAAGYRCTVVRADGGLPVSRYECVAGDRVVRWDRT